MTHRKNETVFFCLLPLGAPQCQPQQSFNQPRRWQLFIHHGLSALFPRAAYCGSAAWSVCWKAWCYFILSTFYCMQLQYHLPSYGLQCLTLDTNGLLIKITILLPAKLLSVFRSGVGWDCLSAHTPSPALQGEKIRWKSYWVEIEPGRSLTS